MSDPVTNSQVEDVLSSIRRLVSDNKKNSTAPAQAPAAPDRLVLTPQLRVSEQGNDPQEIRAETDAGPLQLTPEEAVDPIEDIDHFEEPLPPMSEDEETSSEESDFVFSRRHRSDPGSDAQSETDDAPAVPEAARSDLSSKIAALETAIARTADQWEPDGNGRDAYAGTPAPSLSWESDVDLDGTGAPLGNAGPIEPVATVGKADFAQDFDDDQIIDEAALRQLVGEIVRSELQGELGERITRNVRRLVHREIMRALAARDLD